MAANETLNIEPSFKAKLLWLFIYANIYGIFGVAFLNVPYAIVSFICLVVALVVSWDAYRFLTACLKRKPFYRFTPTHFEDNYSRPLQDDPIKIPWEQVKELQLLKPKQLSLIRLRLEETSPYKKRLPLFTWPSGYRGERFIEAANQYRK